MRTTFIGIFTAVFVALLPFLVSNHLFYGAENLKSFFFIGFIDLLLMGAVYTVSTQKIKISLGGKWFLYASLFLLAVEYVASLLGVDVARSLWSDITRSTGVLFISHVAIGAYLLAFLLREADWSLLRKTIAISAAVFSFLEFLGTDGFGLTSNVLWFSLKVSGLTIANTTFAGAYAVLALILALIELSRTESKGWRYGLIGSIVMILISPLLIGSNLLFDGTTFSEVVKSPSMLLGSARSSSIVAYALMVFMGGVLLFKRLPTKIKSISLWGWAGAWLLGITIGLGLLFTPGSVVQNAYIQTSTAARIIVWEDALKGIAERPLLGWGPENFVYVFDRHFDNRLFLKENIGEIWFDRAHNVFVDTLAGSGVIGVGAFVLLIFALWAVLYRAHKKGRIGTTEAIVLAALPIAHILQHQTAFDTTITYALLAIIGGYVLWLEKETTEAKEFTIPKEAAYGIAAGLLILSFVSAKFVLLDEVVRQNALFTTFQQVNNIQERLVAIDTSTPERTDFETLRLSSFSFIKGFLQQLGEGKVSQASAANAKKIIDTYDTKYQIFIKAHPDFYRARLDYAYLLLVKTIMGENHLAEAKALLKDSYALAPGNPLTYYVDALGETYGGHIKEARALADAATALNPEIPLSKVIEEYINEQEQSFPTISILKLENI